MNTLLSITPLFFFQSGRLFEMDSDKFIPYFIVSILVFTAGFYIEYKKEK